MAKWTSGATNLMDRMKKKRAKRDKQQGKTRKEQRRFERVFFAKLLPPINMQCPEYKPVSVSISISPIPMSQTQAK
ncbi:hypothetical protein MGYG_08331 [Nannizzia gypsea CBS 118893]|uniref:Uncharacterized protein n=1 Tax=Arthroderma gypseum (strain ATCC MYA-4604 / CBS 118893) TaxID=535722 RepID=E4V5E5_ARTGP|nr:hypothetical protein MGYG_08331 [Nannizzia gypsea CBS 118893]EFR05320.1 hypothetical protein MGYG_08331 [Nannizzia gypsea CBS 118893]